MFFNYEQITMLHMLHSEDWKHSLVSQWNKAYDKNNI